MSRNPINVEQVLATFAYDEVAGILVWSPSAHCCGRRGKPAGKITKQGYVCVRWFGRRYMAHRLLWALLKGECPEVVDHINGIRNDNRIENLRAASDQINNQNRRSPTHNSVTGFLGVTLCKTSAKNPFIASIKLAGVRHYLGGFPTAEQAHAAYIDGKRRLHIGNTL